MGGPIRWRMKEALLSTGLFLLLLLSLILCCSGTESSHETTHHFSTFFEGRARLFREVVEPHPSLHLRAFRPFSFSGSSRVRRQVPLEEKWLLEEGHEDKLRLELELGPGNRTVTLNLIQNKDLFPKGHFVRHQDKEGKDVLWTPNNYQDVENCHYKGSLVGGGRKSWAALSTCDGHLSGLIFDGVETHYIHPKGGKGGDPWSYFHLRAQDFKGKENETKLGDGRVSHTPSDPQGNSSFLSSPSLRRVKRGLADHSDLRLPFNSNGGSRWVELIIVVDNKKYRELGGDLKATVRRVKEVSNIVNALYQPFNIFIALVGVVVWSERDEVTLSANGDTSLSSFLQWRRERLLPKHRNDNAQLLTAVEFENGVVGKAMQGPMCSYKYSGGVNSDFRHAPSAIVATTVAHEMGHNFGLSHDAEECSCPSGRCIMAASANSNRSSEWSDCSVKDMAFAFAHGMDYCLRNPPSSLWEGPTCGNGFTEPGEECDCGLPEHCDNHCCDAANCLIHDNATCASGTCCDTLTCHVKTGGTVCREPQGLCDLPEYCTGDSEFCPEDVRKLDGVKCESGSGGGAFCSAGECRTHTDQCKLLWGPSGSNSDDLCYQRNANGSRVAHCGYDLVSEKYSACPQPDTSCGVLHCQMNSEKLEFGYESAAILASFFVNSGGKIHPCRSVIVDFGLSDPSPGLVPDGAPCGKDKMCLRQKCVDASEVRGALVRDCGGHGVVNSKGHCHCDEGYGGNFCEGGGIGGSVDSGPPLQRGGSKILKALKVTVFGFLPLIALITFYLYYADGSLKKIFMEIRRNGLTAVATGSSPSSPSSPSGRRGPPKPPPPPSSRGGGGQQNGGISSRGSGSGSGPTSPMGEDMFGNYKGFSLSPIKESSKANGNNNTKGGRSAANNNNIPPSSHQRVDVVLVGNSSTTTPPSSSSNGNGGRSVSVSWAQPIESRHPLSPTTSPPGDEEDSESAGSDAPLQDEGQGHGHGQGSSRPPAPLKKLKKEHSFSGLTNRLRALNLSDLSSPFRGLLARSNSTLGGQGGSNGRGRIEISRPIITGDFPGRGHDLVAISPLDTNKESQRYANIPLADEVDGSTTPTKDDCGPRYANVPMKPALKVMDRVRETTPPPSTAKTTTPTSGGSGKKVQRAQSMISSTPANRNSLTNYNSLSRRSSNRPTAPPPKPPGAPPSPPPPNPQQAGTPPRTFFKSSTPPPYVSKFPANTTTNSNITNSEWLRNKLAGVGNGTAGRSNSNTSTDSGISTATESSDVTIPPIVKPARPSLRSGSGNSPSGNSNSPARSQSPARSYGSSPNESPARPFVSSNQSGGNENPAPVIGYLRPSYSRFGAGQFRSIFLNATTSKPFFPKTTPTPTTAKAPPSPKDEDNIYDTIDEGICPALEDKFCKVDLASSESSGSSPPDGGGRDLSTTPSALLLEKIETLSTGSSEGGGAGGLLSEIISEIKTRNRESIYNSIDRKRAKQRKKELANQELANQRRETTPPKRPQSPYKRGATPTTTTNATTPPPNPKPNSPKLNTSNNSSYNRTPPTSSSATPYQRPSPPRVSFALTTPPTVTAAPNPPAVPPHKPMAAVNGIPKTPVASATATPTSVATPISAVTYGAYQRPNPPTITTATYVAKINATPLSSSGNNMRPISSLPATKGTTPNEIIYAPSSVLSGGEPGEKSHLSTIRRSRPAYLQSQSVEEESKKDEAGLGTTPPQESVFIKKHGGGGIYASLGRKVSGPKIARKDSSFEKDSEITTPNNKEASSNHAHSVPSHSAFLNENEVVTAPTAFLTQPRPLTFSTFKTGGGNNPNRNSLGAKVNGN